uniref:Uncharacterized protein n=1 Tax=Ciona savignyi TaxID=51511 RepID=H2YAL8_CIOSA
MTTSPVSNGPETHMAIKQELNLTDNGTKNSAKGKPIGKISGTDFEFWISKDKVVIGRNSSHGQVDVNIGSSSYVSRKHLQITHTRGRFFLQCIGKNGVFVDGQFQRLHADPLPLDNACVIRFPSTNIQLEFSPYPPEPSPNGNTPHKVTDAADDLNSATEKPAVLVPPKSNSKLPPQFYVPGNNCSKETQHPINPTQHFKYLLPREVRGFLSAPPSPTGTISAVNSCPSSPRSSHMRNQNNNITENLNAAASVIAASVGDSQGDKTRESGEAKPPYSYAQLIIQAISSSPHRQLTLSGIYAHIVKNYPYYHTADKGWQNSIRHNLSLNRYFVKVPRSQEESGKGSFWKIDPASERKLVEQAWRKRRQRSVPCFCAPLTSTISTVTRSAPVSPEHPNPISPPTQSSASQDSNDNSLSSYENSASKIHFVQFSSRYAQSAPGSPSNAQNVTSASESLQHLLPTSTQAGGKVVWPVANHGRWRQIGISTAAEKEYSGVINYSNAPAQFQAPSAIEVQKQLSIVMQPSNNPSSAAQLPTQQQLLQHKQFQQPVVMVSGVQTQPRMPINIGTIVAPQSTLVASGGVPFMIPGNAQYLMKRPADPQTTVAHKKLKVE